jgi:hypothetical protein
MAIDTQFFDQIDAQLALVDAKATALAASARGLVGVEKAALERDLQAIIDATFPNLSAQYAQVLQIQAALAPALALLTLNPADLPGVISFLSGFIEHFLTPQLAPYLVAEAKAAATIARVASLVSHVESVASHIPDFTPSIPSFP